jgi:carbon-monoxide dehydrogenase iron sulfur subunit
MPKAILLDLERCGACHICEMVCSLSREGECNPSPSRIRVLRGEMKETLLVCQQCDVLFCAAVCPKGAIHRDEGSGTVLVDESLCNGCQACVAACPHQAIAFHHVRKRALICDHCGGDPLCVQWCPRQALLYVELDQPARQRKQQEAGRAFALLRQISP